MTDREKVIKGLGCCTKKVCIYKDTEKECPYLELCGEYESSFEDCTTALAKDALALLKAQEPRVMTLDEVLELKFDDVVYLEDFPTKSVFSAIVIEVVPKLPDIDIGVVQFRFARTWNGINNADLSYYGKVWRCWTSRPTDEQREATPWEK